MQYFGNEIDLITERLCTTHTACSCGSTSLWRLSLQQSQAGQQCKKNNTWAQTNNACVSGLIY